MEQNNDFNNSTFSDPCEGPSCVPVVYSIKDVWPPDYQEQLMRHYTINADTIIEVKEHLKDEGEDNIRNEGDEDEIENERHNDDINREENDIENLVPASSDVTEDETDTIDIPEKVQETRISSQYLEPPVVSSSLVYLQSSNRRNSLLSSKHQTM